MSQKVLDLLQEKFADAVLATGSHVGDEWARVKPDAIPEILRYLKDDPETDMKLLSDLTAVDYLEFDPKKPLAVDDPERIEVVYQMTSITNGQRVRLRVRCGIDGVLPTATGVFRTADWWERLVYDFYGVRFEGHPKMRRILLYEEFKGHPLLKDYPIHKRQPLIPEQGVKDLVRGPGPGKSNKRSPFSQRDVSRPKIGSDSYD